VKNTLAYYDTVMIMTEKSLIVQAPGGCTSKLLRP